MANETGFGYKPDMNVVRSARQFIRSLCEAYGSERGMEVWDHIRRGMGDDMAADIFLGMLTGTGDIEVRSVAEGRKIEAIKEVRHLTRWGLKESKDFVEKVEWGGPQRIDVDGIDDKTVDEFVRNMTRIGCVVS